MLNFKNHLILFVRIELSKLLMVFTGMFATLIPRDFRNISLSLLKTLCLRAPGVKVTITTFKNNK